MDERIFSSVSEKELQVERYAGAQQAGITAAVQRPCRDKDLPEQIMKALASRAPA